MFAPPPQAPQQPLPAYAAIPATTPPLRHRLRWFWYKYGNLAIITSVIAALVVGVFGLRAYTAPPPFAGIWTTSIPSGTQTLIINSDHTGSYNNPNEQPDLFNWKQDGSFLILTGATNLGLPEANRPRSPNTVPMAWSVSDAGTVLTVTRDNFTLMYSRVGHAR